ncbi:MAG: hypothetical protein AAFW97_00960 [Pseudomonadota bacterium]
MTKFLITYDNKAPRDYRKLYQLMASWRAVRLAESVWLAELRGPAGIVRNCVQNALQRDDVVAVIELKPGSDWATNHVHPAASDWLANNVMPRQRAA